MARNYSSISEAKTLTANVTNVATQITLNNVTGLPSAPYVLVLSPDTANEEAVLVTVDQAGVTSPTLKVTRGIETGATAKTHTIGNTVKHMIVGSDLQSSQDHIDDTTTAHGATGAVVGTTNTQTLTNKTINSATNTLTVAQSAVTNLVSDLALKASTSDLALKAPLASPTFTGTPTLPTGTIATTQATTDNTTAIATTAFVQSRVTIPLYNAQTGTTYTFVLADVGKTVTASNASPQTYTIPPQASVTWLADTTLHVLNLGAGVVTFAAGAGVTVTNAVQTLTQYQSARLVRTASDAWTVTPDSGGAGGTAIAYQASAPSSPATGDIWIESDVDIPDIDSTLYYRWTKTMSGGETSLSGTDNNSLSLVYTVGYESVFINGVLQVRGSDYVATDGTTVTGLTALTASDVVTVESIVAYSIGDTYTQAQTDSLLDAKSPVSTTGLVLLNTTSFSAVTSTSIDNCFNSTYTNYRVLIDYKGDAGAVGFAIRLRIASDETSAVYDKQAIYITGTTVAGLRQQAQTSWVLTEGTRLYNTGTLDFFSPNVNAPTRLLANYQNADANWDFSLINVSSNEHRNSYQATGFTLLTTSASTGTIKVYGYK